MRKLLLFAIAVLAIFPAASLAQEKTIELTIDAVPEKVAGYPVQLGVPFLPGELEDVKDIRVFKNGKAVPFSASEMVRWGGKCSGVKVALVRFQADLDTKPAKDYSITLSKKKIDIAYPRLKVKKQGSNVSVDTGEISFTVSQKPLVLFKNVTVGGKNIIKESVLETVLANGKKFSRLRDGKIEVEESGPVCTAIKVTGSFDDPSAGGLGIIARIYAYAGKPYVKLSYTLIQRKPEPVLKLKGWRLGLVPAKKFDSYEIGGEEKNYFGRITGPVELLQDGELTPKDGSLRVVGTWLKYTGAGTGARAPGWAKVTMQNGEVLVAVRHFWQQYPKSIEISKQILAI